MHGNAWEWCRDWYHKELSGGTDPGATKMATDRVIRGGGWFDFARSSRSAARSRRVPDDRFSDLGFRVAAVQVSK